MNEPTPAAMIDLDTVTREELIELLMVVYFEMAALEKLYQESRRNKEYRSQIVDQIYAGLTRPAKQEAA